MADWFYDLVVLAGRPAFAVSSEPIVIGREHTQRRGAYLLASTHTSPFDVPLIMRHAFRRVDFISITEIFAIPPLAWFYGSMNAFPLERSRPDPKTVRIIYDRLSRGRVVGIFPEGGFRRSEQSVVHSRKIRPGIGRLAKTAGAPIVPCVIVNSQAYAKPSAWLPLRALRYGVAFGEAIEPTGDPEAIERTIVERMVTLHRTLSDQMTSRTSRPTSR